MVILYWCKTWSLTLGKKYRLRVFERGEIRGKWRRFYNGEINDLYS
jgi:hypothetical protein